MSEEEKKKLDKRLKISELFLLINFIMSVVNIAANNKIVMYIYLPTIILLVIGGFLLISVISKRYKKDLTYKLTILYLLTMFIELMNVVLKLDSCQKGF